MRNLRTVMVSIIITSSAAAYAATGGIDTSPGTTTLPLQIEGQTMIDITPTQITVTPPMVLNSPFTKAITINEDWKPDQGLSINSNDIWKSTTIGDSSLYLQYGAPGAAVVVGGDPGATNHLYVFGGLETYKALTTQYGGSPQIFVNGDDHTGGGIAISNDGGFYDYNDGFVTFNGSTGLRIAGKNGPNSLNSSLVVNGTASFLNSNININQTWQADPTYRGTKYTTVASILTASSGAAISIGIHNPGAGTTALVVDGPVISLQSGAYFAGKVGIGTDNPAVALDVTGAIRAGSAGVGANCAAQGSGAMAYDYTNKKPIFCNGAVWAFAGGPTLIGTVEQGSSGSTTTSYNADLCVLSKVVESASSGNLAQTCEVTGSPGNKWTITDDLYAGHFSPCAMMCFNF
jgi:hypothetical protein